MNPLMKGKVALITGAASGIGRATALVFAREGARVAIVDRDQKGAEETLRWVRDRGGEGIAIAADVSRAEDVNRFVRATVEAFGKLDCAFNNAGIEGVSAPTAECSEENWDRTIAINLKGVWLCMKAELEQMLRQGSGSIVNCSSIAGLIGFSGIPAYVASKHGVLGLTKTAALEYAKQGIRVNAVCPGVIETPMIERFTQGDSKAYAALREGEPIARLGKPEEIAEAALWLCSEKSSFVTGHPLVADGGWVAQ